MATNHDMIDHLFREYSLPQTPGACVMVIHHGKQIVSKAYGLANLEQRFPCSLETNFRLASLTKEFTAMSVLMLIEKRKLTLDDSIGNYFKELNGVAASITVRQLLTHTSGMFDYEDLIPPDTKLQLSDRNVLTLIKTQNQTYFSPGSQFRYSNSGYAVLALLVEIISGETFPAYLKSHIFEPLKMSHTVAYVGGINSVSNRAYGYNKGTNGWDFSDQSLTSAVLGDGGIYSSVNDLFQWDQALYTEKLISKKMMEQAFSRHSQTSDFEGSGYGFGWYVREYRGTRCVWHYGSTCGFSTRIERYPEKELTIIILTNRRDAELSAISRQLVNQYL